MQKSYRPKNEDEPAGGGGRNSTVDFRGEKRKRDTHESKTEREATIEMVEALGGTHRMTLGADKNYDIATVWIAFGTRMRHRTSRRTQAIAHRLSTDVPPAMKVMRSVSIFANTSKNTLAGPRPSVACARAGSLAVRSWTSNLS